MRLSFRSAALVLLVGASLLFPAGGAQAGLSLTLPEARYRVHSFLQAVESENVDSIATRRVSSCRRGSPLRVACRFAEEGTDGQTGRRWHCAGKVKVVEAGGSYREWAYGVRCRSRK